MKLSGELWGLCVVGVKSLKSFGKWWGFNVFSVWNCLENVGFINHFHYVMIRVEFQNIRRFTEEFYDNDDGEIIEKK